MAAALQRNQPPKLFYLQSCRLLTRHAKNRCPATPNPSFHKIARDVFFGTLEYSARTIVLRNAERPTGVVANLVAMFEAAYRTPPPSEEQELQSLTKRLETAVERLEERG